jgi:hypothetical protein
MGLYWVGLEFKFAWRDLQDLINFLRDMHARLDPLRHNQGVTKVGIVCVVFQVQRLVL